METRLLGGEAPKKNSPAGICVVFLTFVALVFFIVALATPAVVEADLIEPIGHTTLGVARIGPFKACATLLDSDQKCSDIDSGCKVSISGLSVSFIDNCDRFNGARAMLVIGALFAAGALLAQLMTVCMRSTNSVARAFCVILGLAAAAAGVASMAIFVSYRENDSNLDGMSTKFLYGFWLLTAGWVLALFATLPFCTKA